MTISADPIFVKLQFSANLGPFAFGIMKVSSCTETEDAKIAK